MAQGQLQQTSYLIHNKTNISVLSPKKKPLLQRNRHILGRQNSTFKSAEIVILGHPESVDYQPLDLCQNASPFTGKERDEETGYGYFGARYMDHELMTMWLSVDPMADKYPNISPYNYCAWNPVRLVDPDGREFGDIYNLRGQHIGSDRRNDNVVYLKSTWSNRQLSTVESNFLIMFGGVKNITEETGLTNDELNLRATLSTIKQAEAGRKNPPLDYNSWNGSDHFTEDPYVDNPKAYARHPGTNPNTKRSASGAYQFLKRFWDSDDFSPQAQDKAAVNLMTKNGYEAALNGDMAGFINSSSKRWTSLSQWEVSDLQDEFYYNRAKELVGKTNIATPIGSLLKKK